MILDLQFKIKSNPLYIDYLRGHSYWYKTLNRHPASINNFIDEVKSHNRTRTTDKISDVLEKIELIQTIISAIK